MIEYSQQDRIDGKLCPYCGFWHSAISHPPQFNGYILEITRLEAELSSLLSAVQQAEKVLQEVIEDEGCSHGNDARFALDILDNAKPK